MHVLVIGGTRFMGKHLVRDLLLKGYNVTVANRGFMPDPFGDRMNRIIFDRYKETSIIHALSNKSFDIVFDHLAYSSNDVKILLPHIKCKRYIMISSAAVYNRHMNIKEEEFNPLSQPVAWGNRSDFSYDEGKRNAERALFQVFSNVESITVRLPYVIGVDDYTIRLYFYVEHITSKTPMYIDNYDSELGYIRSDEAGKFLSFLADQSFTGAINGAASQTITLRQVTNYIKEKTGYPVLLEQDADFAPYNGDPSHSINIDKAASLGFQFSSLHSWIYALLDQYIEKASNL